MKFTRRNNLQNSTIFKFSKQNNFYSNTRTYFRILNSTWRPFPFVIYPRQKFSCSYQLFVTVIYNCQHDLYVPKYQHSLLIQILLVEPFLTQYLPLIWFYCCKDWHVSSYDTSRVGDFENWVQWDRGELSYLAPLGSENISAPYFKLCFFRGRGYYPPDSKTPCLPVPRQK